MKGATTPCASTCRAAATSWRARITCYGHGASDGVMLDPMPAAETASTAAWRTAAASLAAVSRYVRRGGLLAGVAVIGWQRARSLARARPHLTPALPRVAGRSPIVVLPFEVLGRRGHRYRARRYPDGGDFHRARRCRSASSWRPGWVRERPTATARDARLCLERQRREMDGQIRITARVVQAEAGTPGFAGAPRTTSRSMRCARRRASGALRDSSRWLRSRMVRSSMPSSSACAP